MLYKMADDAVVKGDTYTARGLFHEAAGCFHIGQHIYFIDLEQKEEAQNNARLSYKKAIELYDEEKRPIRLDIPFREAGFNFFCFDGPGQGEMRKDMKMVPDYEKAVSSIIDWFRRHLLK